ncbi:MAG: glycerol kinase GlpK [Oscillospiraceae bacterium]|jgi:glycerol kinase|nr:glycerol kinase GlpK [Oscillospiraceae bacterium]
MTKDYIIALDQGTTSSRAILFNKSQEIMAVSQKEFRQIYPQSGYVEQDPMEIYSSQYGVLMEVVAKSGISPAQIAAVGITNQRETTIIWDKNTGEPVYNAIVWQCRRTSSICERLKDEGWEPYIRETTGLVIDAYFSATKIAWILDQIPGARKRAEAGELLFGTVDTWLIWKLTGGKVHATDYTNASRTMLFNISTLEWDQKILNLLKIPRSMLPEARPSSGHFGTLNLSGVEIPISGAAGDQQAALYGQTCFDRGSAKNTYGTGCFLLMNTGETLCRSKNGMLTTIAASQKGKIRYALEGSVFTAGAVVQWLRDELHLITESSDSEYFARKVPDCGGVYMVPAFTGLGAPHWDMYARGALVGLSRGSNKNHIIRACLESIAYQSRDLLEAIESDTGIPLDYLRVDGGASANNFLMQFQADILDCEVRRPKIRETTALGAALLAGLAVGMWKDEEEIRQCWTLDRAYIPLIGEEQRTKLIRGWNKAVERAKSWETEE